MPTQQQIDEANAQLAATNRQVEDGLVALNQIKLEHEGVQAGIDRLNKNLIDTKTRFDQLSADLDTATTARTTALADLNDLGIKINAAKAELAATETANKQTEVLGEQITTNVKADQDKIVANAQDKVDQLTAQKTDLEQKISTLTDQLPHLTDQIGGLNAQIISLNGQIVSATTVLRDLNNKQATAQQNLADIQAKSDAVTNEITTKQAQSTSCDTDIATKNASITDLAKKIADMAAELQKNSLLNADYLKARANVVALQQANEQRTDLLKQKYGDLGEPFN